MAPDTSRLGRRFRRYRRKGDLAALGDVFDEAAPQLLRLARRFARGDEALAEDAVQSAFLVAMEKAGDFDGGRPVMPWLLGILAVELRKERASSARLPDPRWLEEGARGPESPEDAAAERELKDLVAAKVEQLPETYREAVRAHLFSRGDAATTAERLGVTRGALHVRVHRGLGMLRGMLPAGAAMAAGLVMTAPRGLAGMRTAVLGSGQATLVPQAAAAALSAKAALALASIGGVVLGGGAVAALWRAEREAAPRGSDQVATNVHDAAAATGAVVPDLLPEARERTDRDRAPVPGAPESTAAAPSAAGDGLLTEDDWVRLYAEASGYTDYFLLGERLIALPDGAGLGVARAIYPRLGVQARQQFGKPFLYREGAPFGLDIADLVARDPDAEVQSFGLDLVRTFALRSFDGDPLGYGEWRAATAGQDRAAVLRGSAEWLEARLTAANADDAARLLAGASVPARQTLKELGVEPSTVLAGPGATGALEMLVAAGGPKAVLALGWLHLTPMDAGGYGSMVVPLMDGDDGAVRKAAAMSLAMSGLPFAADELTRRFASERGLDPTDPRAADLDGWGLWLHNRR